MIRFFCDSAKIKGISPHAGRAFASYFLWPKSNQKDSHHFTARHKRWVPCSARLSQEPPNSLRSDMRRLFFRLNLRASAANRLFHFKIKARIKSKNNLWPFPSIEIQHRFMMGLP